MADWEKIKEPKDKPAGKPDRESETAVGTLPIERSRVRCETWVSITVKPAGEGAGKNVWESCSRCEDEDGKAEHVHHPKDSDGVIDEKGVKVDFVAQFDKQSGAEIKPWHVGNGVRGTHKGKFYQKCVQTKTSIMRCVKEHKKSGHTTWTAESAPEWSKRVNTYEFGPSVSWESEQTKSCLENMEPLAMSTDDLVSRPRPNSRRTKA